MKRIGLILLSLFLLCTCQSEIEATLEDSVIVAMDDSNVSEEEITSLSKEEKKGDYYIVFETATGHYEYKIGKDGQIKDRDYQSVTNENVEEEKKEEEEVQPEHEEKTAEEKKDEISEDAKQRALEAACINMGIDTGAPQNVQVTMEEGQLVVRFDFGEGVTYVTTVDPNSYVATSSYSI